MREIETLAILFKARFLRSLLANYPQLESSPWQGLAFFLEGYAYERQGRSPEYGPAAADALLSVQAEGHSFDAPRVATLVWERYCQLLADRSPNARLNPMCPQGTTYPSRAGVRAQVETWRTYQPCALEFMQAQGGNSIVAWARDWLRAGEVQQVHQALTTINGVGPKIASFFLRDVALLFGVEPGLHRELLQPVDVWVRRIVQYLSEDDTLTNGGIARWIVDESLRAGVSPERINQGMWYLGAQIAGSQYVLKKCLTGLEDLRQMCQRHGESLADAAAAMQQQTEGRNP